MHPRDTLTRGDSRTSGPDTDPGDDPPDDRGLLDRAVASAVAQNRAHAERLQAMHRFYARRVAEAETRSAADHPGFFLLTPLQATTAELAPLLGLSEIVVHADVDLVEGLQTWFPGLWQRCLSGRLDIGRARLAHDQLANLTSEADKKAFAALVEEYLDRVDDPSFPICRVSRRSFQAAVRRRCLKFPQRSEQDTFAEAFRRRRVSLRTDENGIASLSVVTAAPDAVAADYRLTLIAKKLREADEETRNLEQLRADVLIDLIHGRLTVGADSGELEEDATADGQDPGTTFARQESVGAYARPVINVTVPVTTLMGLDDTPATMTGDISLPAELVRQLALHPEATWYRLLTDQAGGFLELSVDSYAPSEPICRWTVARDSTCVWPGCSRPATVCELDHRLAYPSGPTSTGNLQPLCRRHHLVKHSEGFGVVRNPDGSYTWTSRFGSIFHTAAPEHPSPTWPTAAPATDVGSVIEREFRSWMERTAAR